MTTCALCSSVDKNRISVLCLYYDSMSFNSVTMLDAAVVTVMCSLDEPCDDDDRVQHYVELLNPDVIRNHYFLNVCYENEKTVNRVGTLRKY